MAKKTAKPNFDCVVVNSDDNAYFSFNGYGSSRRQFEAYVEKANISTAIPADAKTAVDTKVASEKAVADVKTTLEAADAALLEAVTNVSNSKVDKTSILAAVSKAPSDEKVLSEKAVDALIKAVKQEISEGLSWDDQTVV